MQKAIRFYSCWVWLIWRANTRNSQQTWAGGVRGCSGGGSLSWALTQRAKVMAHRAPVPHVSLASAGWWVGGGQLIFQPVHTRMCTDVYAHADRCAQTRAHAKTCVRSHMHTRYGLGSVLIEELLSLDVPVWQLGGRGRAPGTRPELLSSQVGEASPPSRPPSPQPPQFWCRNGGSDGFKAIPHHPAPTCAPPACFLSRTSAQEAGPVVSMTRPGLLVIPRAPPVMCMPGGCSLGGFTAYPALDLPRLPLPSTPIAGGAPQGPRLILSCLAPGTGCRVFTHGPRPPLLLPAGAPWYFLFPSGSTCLLHIVRVSIPGRANLAASPVQGAPTTCGRGRGWPVQSVGPGQEGDGGPHVPGWPRLMARHRCRPRFC